MESLAVVFGRRVKELRQARGLTQEQLGRAAKLDYKHVSAIERGAKPSSFQAVEKLADALQVQYYEMFLPEARIAGNVEKDINAMIHDASRVEPKNIEEFLKGLRAALRKLEK